MTLLMRPWPLAEAVAAVLFAAGGMAVALSAEFDVMPEWVDNWQTGPPGLFALETKNWPVYSVRIV